MSDRDNLEALKRMLENKETKEAEMQLDKEKRFLHDAAKAFLGEGASEKAIREYDPEKMIAFLEQKPEVVQKEMGGEWLDIKPEEFELFVYSMDKKVKKSTQLIDWKS